MWLDRLRPSTGQPISQRLHLASLVEPCTGNQTGSRCFAVVAEVEDDARCRIHGEGKAIKSTLKEYLHDWSTNQQDRRLQSRGGVEAEAKIEGLQISRIGNLPKRIDGGRHG
jgi:hypothetical protein